MNFISSITLMFKDAFSSGFSNAKNSLAGMQGAISEINKNQEMNRMAADLAMMTSMTDPLRQKLSAALSVPAQLAGGFESKLKNIQFASGRTAQEMVGLRKELLAIGGRSVAGPLAVAAAFDDISAGVVDADSHLAALNASIKLAEANQGSLSTATTGMIRVMNAYGLSADDAEYASNVLSATFVQGAGSMDEFLSAMAPITGLSANAGITFDELGASMAYLTAQGLTTTTASRQMKGMINSLINPSETLSDVYKELGFASGSAMIQEHGLAKSLEMVRSAFGGNDEAMAKALGGAESLQGALHLTKAGYADFARSFGNSLDGYSDAAQKIQLESIESKMARMEAATDSLKTTMGGDINSIRGFFLDMKIGFLQNVAMPIMESPVGPAISKISAVVGMSAKSILDMGSGALNTASQLSVLTANISNAGGIAKLFTSSLGFMKSTAGMLLTPLKVIGSGFGSLGKGIIGILPKMGAWIVSAWSAAVANMAAFWPILLIIGGIALLTAGIILLVKNWSKVSAFFVGLWTKIKNAFLAGINWIKKIIFGASNWILGAVALFVPFIGIPLLIIKNWDTIKSFFSGLWGNLVSGFTGAWSSISGFFTGIWDGIKDGLLGFVNWALEKVNILLGPFKGLVDTVGRFFKEVTGGSKESGEALTETFASGISANSNLPGEAFGTSLAGIDAQMPHSNAKEGPLSKLSQSGRALTDTFASGMEPDVLTERASLIFNAASPEGKAALNLGAFQIPGQSTERPNVTIQNLTIQANDFEDVWDFIKQLMNLVKEGEYA